MSFIVNSGYFKICNSLLNLGSFIRVQWWNIKNGKGTKKSLLRLWLYKRRELSEISISWDDEQWPLASVPPAGHNSGAPPLIKRSLVSLFVSNWPIGGSQSSRTTCPPTSHNLIHIFYCAENITYIMEKYYNICWIFPSVFTVSKLAWIMSWRIVEDRDWVLRRDYALQHLAV